jgi:hypothetical protein
MAALDGFGKHGDERCEGWWRLRRRGRFSLYTLTHATFPIRTHSRQLCHLGGRGEQEKPYVDHMHVFWWKDSLTHNSSISVLAFFGTRAHEGHCRFFWTTPLNPNGKFNGAQRPCAFWRVVSVRYVRSVIEEGGRIDQISRESSTLGRQRIRLYHVNLLQ